MELNNNKQNFRVIERKMSNGKVGLYTFVADEEYCFRNNAEPLTNDEGNQYFDHCTAFTLLAHEIDKLADYDCIQIENNFIIH